MASAPRIDLGVLRKESKHPLHRQLFELIRGAIESGVYRPGDRLESERWFVKHARLSQPTVARAFRDLASEGWVVRRTGSGTYVNEKKLETGRTVRRVGVSYYNVETPYFERMFSGIRAATHSTDIELVVVPTGLDFEHEEDAMGVLERDGVDGIIAVPFGTESMQRHLTNLVHMGMPVVAIGVQMPRLLCDTVGFDFEQSGYLAAEHLLTYGHRRLAFLCTEVLYPDTTNLELTAGIRMACSSHRVELQDAHIVQTPIVFLDEAASRPWAALQRLFGQPADQRPTALICQTDGLARMAYDVLGDLGLRIPQDVSITGGADLPIAAQLDPPLTTVAWPLERLGRTALRMLLDRAHHPTRQPIHRVLDTQLIIRRSTRLRPAS